jgi:hypothetical protein
MSYETRPATGGVSVTVNTATLAKTRGLWIGTSQSLDFCFDGTNWVTHQGCMAGTYIPVQVLGVRKTSGSAAPTAGDVVAWY